MNPSASPLNVPSSSPSPSLLVIIMYKKVEPSPSKVQISYGDLVFTDYPPGWTCMAPAGCSMVCENKDEPDVVVKCPHDIAQNRAAVDMEARIYERLGPHANLVRVLRKDDYGIYMERAQHGCLRVYYMEGGAATPAERLRWCEDVARVLHHVHARGVLHRDLSGRNLLLDAARNLLLCDFSGSSMDGTKSPMPTAHETGFAPPASDECPATPLRAELHALGSTIFEIVTGLKPFVEEHRQWDSDSVIDRLMLDGKYPDVSHLPLGDVIAKCWTWNGDGFASAAEVADAIADSGEPQRPLQSLR